MAKNHKKARIQKTQKQLSLNNCWVSIKEDFDIAGIIFLKGSTGTCVAEGPQSFSIEFDFFKIDTNGSKEKFCPVLSNIYKRHFEIIQKLEEIKNKPM
jgi:hypothetical protein